MQNNHLEQLREFALDDKFISAERHLAYFQLFANLGDPENLSADDREKFYTWYLYIRNNKHYGQTPLAIAQRYQADSFPAKQKALHEIIIATETGNLSGLLTGLAFKGDFVIPPNKLWEGVFLQNSDKLILTPLRREFPLAMRQQILAEGQAERWYQKTLSELNPAPDTDLDIVDLEDRARDVITALDIKDIDEVEVSDAVAEGQKIELISQRLMKTTASYPLESGEYITTLLRTFQQVLGVEPGDADEEAEASPEVITSEDTNAELMANLSQQFDDPLQQKFFADFFAFTQEKGGQKKQASEKQALKEMTRLEAEWRATPREALDGLTPDVFAEQHPEVNKTAQRTVRREEAKVGRNDPCPCGSGKKYKKCHGRNL
jgi:hypothetical protein